MARLTQRVLIRTQKTKRGRKSHALPLLVCLKTVLALSIDLCLIAFTLYAVINATDGVFYVVDHFNRSWSGIKGYP